MSTINEEERAYLVRISEEIRPEADNSPNKLPNDKEETVDLIGKYLRNTHGEASHPSPVRLPKKLKKREKLTTERIDELLKPKPDFRKADEIIDYTKWEARNNSKAGAFRFRNIDRRRSVELADWRPQYAKKPAKVVGN